MADNRCDCNLTQLVVAMIFYAVGAFLVVSGFRSQTSTVLNWGVLVWYFLGFLALTIGKILKRKSYGSCPTHKR